MGTNDLRAPRFQAGTPGAIGNDTLRTRVNHRYGEHLSTILAA